MICFGMMMIHYHVVVVHVVVALVMMNIRAIKILFYLMK